MTAEIEGVWPRVINIRRSRDAFMCCFCSFETAYAVQVEAEMCLFHNCAKAKT